MSDDFVSAESDLGPDFESVVLSCIIREKGFFESYESVLQRSAFSSPAIWSLITLCRDYFRKYRVTPSPDILKDLVRNSDLGSPGTLVALVDGLPTEVGHGEYVRDRLLNWLRWTAVNQVLANHELRLDPTAFAEEISRATRLGDDLIHDGTDLSDMELGEDLRGEIMPSPWSWLNQKLNGGPIRGDLMVVMTVINGGKTTSLVNIAREYAAYGKNVVYFTFEDGETKIKRRLMQSICGFTVEEMMNQIDVVKKKTQRFLERSGGNVHIRQLKSRRTSVDEAMAVVKNIAERTGREVDVVVTDYADRFRPVGRYSEPRHGLREVYEDCKFLASDLKVLHVTASQINTKQMAGKDVVGIEHGSESTGKFESCDIAIGFGQTMEDKVMKRYNLHTSKMRDGQSGETHGLYADFARQRVYEPDDARFLPK